MEKQAANTIAVSAQMEGTLLRNRVRVVNMDV
jgi:hypothetical protein